MATGNAASLSISGDVPALPVMPQNNGASFAGTSIAGTAPPIAPQNDASFAPPPAINNIATVSPPVVNDTNNVQTLGTASHIPVPPVVTPPVAMAAAGAVNNMQPANNMMQPAMPEPIVQNPQNGYMPGPQQVQNSDGEQNNVHFGEPVSDPFANAIAGSQKTDAAWK